jgi:DMSO/TMAO reductase YedYZ heme-binding membrane subunit
MTDSRRYPLDTLFLLAVGMALSAWCVIAFRAGGYYIEREIFVSQLSGYAALGYLALSLCAGPLLRLLSFTGVNVPREFSARLSRNAGIAAALAAILHTTIVLMTYLKHDWLSVLFLPYLRWGGLAFVVLLVLLVASFKPLMSVIRWKLWKPLFRLSFLAALFTLPHLLYAPFSSRPLTLWLYGIATAICCLRWLPLVQVSNKPSASSNSAATQPVTT